MIELDRYVGEVLDEKYRLERLLGQGGMGAVYLATHLGTERYVALKLITPQFMQNEEFVQRFKREARAAGRLRHPNVVDVTDFGFAQVDAAPVAYLVMEYLDGCTLGDVLSEEKRLPLEWVVDILEQVCSAVHEAHQQGVVHRDLKPENIWLEPNRLGGYRVKVLDFGIAKLGSGEIGAPESAGLLEKQISPADLEKGTLLYSASHTDPDLTGSGSIGDPPSSHRTNMGLLRNRGAETQIDSVNSTLSSGEEPEATSISAAVESNRENETQAFSRAAAAPQSAGLGGSDESNLRESSAEAETAIFNPSADETQVSEASRAPAGSSDKSTKIGLVGGDAETAIFSSVQGYADSKTIGLHHATTAYSVQPPGLSASATQPTQLTRVGAIMGTPLYMSPEQCAARNLDARSDIYSLGVIAYQMLAGEPPFAGNTATVMKGHIESAPPPLRDRVKIPKRAARIVMSALAKNPAERPQTAAAFANSLRAEADGIGTLYRRAFALYFEHFPKFFRMSLLAHIPVIISTLFLIGLEVTEKYVTLGPGITAARVFFVVAVIFAALMQVCSYFVAAAAIAGMTAVIVTQLSVAPLRPMELKTAFAVIKKRWRAFLRTSIRVTIRQIIGFILFVIPGFIVSIRYMLYAPVVLMEGLEKKAALKRARQLASRSWRTVIIIVLLQFLVPIVVSILMGKISVSANSNGELQVTNSSLSSQIYQQVSGLINIFVVPLASIVSALLYLKMRQLGGETLSSALDQIEDINVDRSQWQKRMRTRLQVNSARSASNSGGSGGNPRSPAKFGSGTDWNQR